MKISKKIQVFLVYLFYCCSSCAADGIEKTDILNQLSKSAQEKLQVSVQELNGLRGQIESEKFPIAKELTDLEEKLTKMRSEYDQVTRAVDGGNLEITNIRSDIKLRQDELTYITNLLDEYVKSFDSRTSICELQYLGAKLGTAKRATENNTLPLREKVCQQTDFVDVSLDRLDDLIGGMCFSGIGVDTEGIVENGLFAIFGPIAIFSATKSMTTGIVVAQTGSDKPLIRPLDEQHQEGIREIIKNGKGLLPLDPSRGGALKAMMKKTDLVHIFKKGGPIMWPLLFTALLAFVTVVERLLFLTNEKRKREPKKMEMFLAAIADGHIDMAIRISQQTKFHVVRVLGYALSHKERSLENGLLYAKEQELKRFRRGIPILDTVITLAPLLGLLGTVTGMMGSFSLIGGELSAPGAITGGIAEALIATAFGLGIAITSLIPFNFLNTKVEEAQIEIESAATQLELLMHSPMNAVPKPPVAEMNLKIL